MGYSALMLFEMIYVKTNIIYMALFMLVFITAQYDLMFYDYSGTYLVDDKKRLYYLRVWLVTEMQPLKKLKNFSKRCWGRSSCYELDHVLPIAHAYLENIPPHLVGSMDNLRFIPKKENRDKSFRLTEDSHKILRKFKRKQDIYKKKK